MKSVSKILAQLAPSATTLTFAYEAPGTTLGELDTLIICNRGATTDTVRVAISASNTTAETKDYIYYGLQVPAGDTFVSNIGLKLPPGATIRVYSTVGSTSFGLYGAEVYPYDSRI